MFLVVSVVSLLRVFCLVLILKKESGCDGVVFGFGVVLLVLV
jgi:hypothetical protein